MHTKSEVTIEPIPVVHSVSFASIVQLLAASKSRERQRAVRPTQTPVAMHCVHFFRFTHLATILELAQTPRLLHQPPTSPGVTLLAPRDAVHLSFYVLRSFRNRSTHDLCPEEAALCPLNDLLVYALRRVIHDDCAGLVVNLGVDACVPDQVDDPFLAFIL